MFPKTKEFLLTIKIIKDIYDEIVTSVRTSGGIASDFPIAIGLHQR